MSTRVPVHSGTQWRLRATAFLSSYDRFTIPPLLVPIHRDLGVSLGTAAALASAYFIAYGLSQPLWGALSDRVGRVAVMRGAVAAGGVACLTAAVAQDFVLLLVARTLAGLCFGALVPTAITYIGDTVDEGRQHALAIMMACATSGVACATIIGGVAAELVTWRAAFLLSAALAAVVAFLLHKLPEPVRQHEHATFLERARAVRGQGWVAVIVGLGFVEGAVIFGSLTFVAASLQQAGVGAAVAGSAAAGFGVANVACTPIVTRAIPRVSSPLLIAGGSALAAAGLLAAAIDATVLTAVAATLALGAGFGFLHSTMQLWATQVYPAARAITVALFVCAIFTGGALASAVAAPLADDGHFRTIFVSAAVGAVVLAIMGSVLRGRWMAGTGRPPDDDHAATVAL